jgi:transposase InsO family protein
VILPINDGHLVKRVKLRNRGGTDEQAINKENNDAESLSSGISGWSAGTGRESRGGSSCQGSGPERFTTVWLAQESEVAGESEPDWTGSATTESDHDLPIFDNQLKQDFSAEEPNQKWVGDITYLWTSEGWVYLAVVIDLYSRIVIGWAMSDRMKTSLVCDALTMALWRRGKPSEVIVHTDRGSQYCSTRYRSLLEHHALIGSMSGTGNCYDNAVAESFFHTLKVEAIHGKTFPTRHSVTQEVFEYIEVYYNRNRRYSTNGYASPQAFELTKKVA